MVYMRHLYANTYHGFQKSKLQMSPPNDRRILLETYINKYHFDVIILFEMFEGSFVNVSLPYIHHIPSSGYFIASRYPISNIHSVAKEMTRPLLSFKINNCSYLIAHIPPKKYCDRTFEESAFLQQLQILDDQSIVIADLNVQREEPFVKHKIQEIGWNNAIQITGVDYLFQRVNKSFIKHIEVHHDPNISDHPLFQFSLPITNVASQFQIMQQNIRNLQPAQKEDLYDFWKKWTNDMQREYELFFQNNSKEFFSTTLSDFQNIVLTIEYYEDTDFYEFWTIEIECSNQTISFPTHWLNMPISLSREQFWKEELNIACSTILNVCISNENQDSVEEKIWKQLQYINEIVSKNTEHYFEHGW